MEESSKKDEFEETVKKLEEKVGERTERKVSSDVKSPDASFSKGCVSPA